MIQHPHPSPFRASLALLVALAGCGAPGPESARQDVLRFVEAAHRGDLQEQMRLLARPEDRTEHGETVVRALHPDRQMRHFTPDSAVLAGVRGDTAFWVVWGKEPNWERYEWPLLGPDGRPPVPRDPTDAEVRALPRITGSHVVVLARTPDGWKLPLDAAALGPVLATSDSLVEVCDLGTDPRRCRPMAERNMRGYASLSGPQRARFSYVQTFARRALRRHG